MRYSEIQYVEKLIQYIEEHLSDSLSVEELARAGFISRSKVYRDFYSVVGHPVKEYIRKRRLSNALVLIRQSDCTLADIAYQCGYSSQQALCRAVKQGIGVTPLEYKGMESSYFFYPSHGNYLYDIIVRQEEFPVLYGCQFYLSNARELEKRALQEAARILPDFSGDLYGKNGMQRGNELCYEMYVSDEIMRDCLVASGCFQRGSSLRIPEGNFAQTAVSYDFERETVNRINDAWDYLSQVWLPQSAYQIKQQIYLEKYWMDQGAVREITLFLALEKGTVLPEFSIQHLPERTFWITDSEKNQKRMLQYLSMRNPNYIKTIQHFYVGETEYGLLQGVEISEQEKNIPIPDFIRVQTIDAGLYIIVKGNSLADYRVYCDKLIDFARNNGMTVCDDAIFGVYQTDDGFKNPRLCVYGRYPDDAKLKQNDNTERTRDPIIEEKGGKVQW